MSAPLGLTDAQLNLVFCAAGIIPHHPSVRLKMQLNFWIDAADKSLTFADGARLRVIRFGPSWISGYRDDIRYEFNRSDGTLTFAGSTSEGTATTTVLGSGNCKNAVVSTGLSGHFTD
jgi:hypothetical protein